MDKYIEAVRLAESLFYVDDEQAFLEQVLEDSGCAGLDVEDVRAILENLLPAYCKVEGKEVD